MVDIRMPWDNMTLTFKFELVTSRIMTTMPKTTPDRPRRAINHPRAPASSLRMGVYTPTSFLGMLGSRNIDASQSLIRFRGVAPRRRDITDGLVANCARRGEARR